MNHQVPLLGQGMSREQAAQLEVAQAVSQLSLNIYSHLAIAHLATLDVHQNADEEKLRGLSKSAQLAARCYFEGLGIAKFRK